MEMRQVEYFRALSEELNFTRAAKRCGASQPSLTRAIQSLEEEFGGQLFLREGVRTRLSELGHMIKPHLDQVYNEAHEAVAQARSFHESTRIRLRLGVMCTVAPTDLVQLLTAVRDRHPEIRLDISDAHAQNIEAQLRAGDLDAAILGRPETETALAELHYLPLYREQFVVVSGADHRLSKLEVVRCSDLNNEPYLRRVNCEMADIAAGAFRLQGVSTTTVYQSDRDDWILAMTAAGMGFAFMPSRSVSHPQVNVTPLTEPEFWREISVVTVRGRPHSPAVGALVHEAMRTTRLDDRALGVKQITSGEHS